MDLPFLCKIARYLAEVPLTSRNILSFSIKINQKKSKTIKLLEK